MKTLLLVLAGSLLVGLPACWAIWWLEGEPAPEPQSRPALIDEPSIILCVAGCADARHPTATLTENEYHSLIKAFAIEPLTGGKAQDALLYYGPQAETMLTRLGAEGLDARHLNQLQRELSRRFAYLSVRVIDENGAERVRLDRRRVPFDVQQHLDVDRADNLLPPQISGTIKRVGLHHIWTRF